MEDEPTIMLSLLDREAEPPLLPGLLMSFFALKPCTWCNMAVRLPVKVRTSWLVWSSTYLRVQAAAHTVWNVRPTLWIVSGLTSRHDLAC